MGVMGMQFDYASTAPRSAAANVPAALVPRASVPATIGPYLLHNEIASGGMATVHLAWRSGPRETARVVAIKRLHPQFAKDPEFVTMFLDETRLARRIFHPNVVQALDVVAEDGHLFLVMEYVRGAPLSLLLRRARARTQGALVPPPIAASIVVGALEGLHAAHQATDEAGASLNVVHRDVSPQNVMVGIDGVSRVFDFGIAKAVGRLQTSRQGQLKGKLSYMAPEQIDDEAVSATTDVYAASVVLWEALCGRRLFQADDERGTFAQVMAAHVPAPSTIVPELSAEIDRVVLRGLDRLPANRYESAHAMAEALRACCPLASPAEVGAWVESLAPSELQMNADLVSAIERNPRVVEPFDRHRPAPSWPDEGSGDAAAADAESQISETKLSHPRARSGVRRWRRSSVIALTAMAEVAAVAVGVWLVAAAARTESHVAPRSASIVVSSGTATPSLGRANEANDSTASAGTTGSNATDESGPCPAVNTAPAKKRAHRCL